MRTDIFISDIPAKDGENIQVKDGKDEAHLNQKTSRSVKTPTKSEHASENSLEDFKRQMQEFIAKINADTADMEQVNVKRMQPSSGIRSIPNASIQPKKRVLTEETAKEPNAKRSLPDEKPVRLSNNIKDAVKTICQVCKTEVPFDNMRLHTKREHSMGISEYKLTFGELENNLVEAIYHKCKLCSQKFLLSADGIAKHARLHKITHREFSSRFIVLRGAKAPTAEVETLETRLNVSKKTLETRLNRMTSEELLKELDLMIKSAR